MPVFTKKSSPIPWIVTFAILANTFVSCNTESDTSITSHPNNIAYRWAGLALTCTAIDTEVHLPRPTVTSRTLALTQTAVYDAWTRYDDQAVPVYLNNVPRVKQSGQFEVDKAIAISYAAARALYAYYPDSRREIIEFMQELQLDFNNYTLDPSTPEGIGNLAARNVIESRRNDLSNQFHEEPYSDFTDYKPVNKYGNVVDPTHWYPKPFVDNNNDTFYVDCLTPHWHWVTPFALKSADQFRPGPPPALGSDQLNDELHEVIRLHENLSNEEKALVEFMRDGPHSVQQAGHWLIFARHISRRNKYNVDDDVKLYFLTMNAAMDAFIACWDAKMHYDFARPQALIQSLYPNDSLNGWMGEGKGWGKISGKEWRPYSPSNFLCPPFPSYPSGHSAVSGACSQVLIKFTGSDDFDLEVKLNPGAATEPENAGEAVVIRFETISETAERAGRSRVLGGYHIEIENQVGLELGRQVGDEAWDRYTRLISGK